MQRLSRREFLRLSAVVSGGAIVAACAAPVAAPAGEAPAAGGEAAPAAAPASGELPVPREEAAVINETTVYTVFDIANPFVPNALPQSGYYQCVQEYLFHINWATGEFINWLAESYKYNADFTELTIKTRPEAQWSDGKPFTSADIEFTINMVKGNTALSWGATMVEWVASMEVPDAQTIVLKLTKPNPRFHNNFSYAWSFTVVAKHIWEGQDPLTFKNFPPVGTGPYTLFKQLPERKTFVFERNENYWAKGLGFFPGPKYVVWQTSPPPEAEIADLQNNLIDHSHSYTTDKQLLERSKELNSKVILAPWRDPCPRGIWFNCAKYPLSKPEVRWAIHHCVNKQKAADVLFPWPTVPAVYPWADWGGHKQYEYEDILKEFDIAFDPAKGAKMLDDLGFKPGADGIRVDDKGNKLSFQIIVPQVGVTGEYPIAQDLADELKKIGIEASVKWSEMTPWDEAINTGNFDISSHWWCGDWAESPMSFATWKTDYLKPIGERASAGNWVRLDDQELTDVMKKIEVMSPSDPAIVDLYKQAFRFYMRDMPGIPVVQTTFVMPFNTKYWVGWPEEGKIDAVPFTWWPEFKFVLFNLKKAA